MTPGSSCTRASATRDTRGERIPRVYFSKRFVFFPFVVFSYGVYRQYRKLLSSTCDVGRAKTRGRKREGEGGKYYYAKECTLWDLILGACYQHMCNAFRDRRKSRLRTIVLYSAISHKLYFITGLNGGERNTGKKPGRVTYIVAHRRAVECNETRVYRRDAIAFAEEEIKNEKGDESDEDRRA